MKYCLHAHTTPYISVYKVQSCYLTSAYITGSTAWFNNNNNNNRFNLYSTFQNTQGHLKKWNKHKWKQAKQMERLEAPCTQRGATQETQRSSPSDGDRGKATAEVQELPCWTPADPTSNSGAATIQHHCEPGETTAAEKSDNGARWWITPRLWWREDQQSSDGQPTEHRVCLLIS